MSSVAQLTCLLEKAGLPARTILATITSDSTDRWGDAIDLNGLDLTEFEQNPIVLMQHDASAPVAKVTKMERLAHSIRAWIEFPAAGISALSDQVYGLIMAGVLNAVSVGLLVEDPAS